MAPRPLQKLRELALSVERAAAEEAASGVVKGAAEGLRDELPEVDRQVREVLGDLLTAVGRIAKDAAERDGAPGDLAHTLAASAMRGAIEELEREWQNGGFPLHDLIARINKLLDWGAQYVSVRAHFFDDPPLRAHEIAGGFLEGITDKLHEKAPEIAQDLRALGPLSEELAFKAGRGLVAGAQSMAKEKPHAFADLMEEAGRGLVRGMASAVAAELEQRALPSAASVSGAMTQVAENTAAATVRGAAKELTVQGQALGGLIAAHGGLRRVTRELVGGVLDAIGAKLKSPRLAMAGAGGALATAALLSLRRR